LLDSSPDGPGRPDGSSWPPAGATRTRRWIGAYEGKQDGPTMVIVGGIHGNEPSGVAAVQHVLHELRVRSMPLRGRLLGLAGNLRALAQNVRYLDRDLNRRWYADHLAKLREQAHEQDSPEDTEQRELLTIFDRLDETFDHPLVVMDLHSFSAEGPPFSVFADTLRNRPIAFEMRVPIIFGLEESVEGTLLGYLADLGHIAVGFEAGQHEDPRTLENHIAAIWVALVSAGLLERKDVPELERCEARLSQAAAGLPRAVEIVYRHAITPDDQFRMDPGYENFQEIERGQRLAVDRDGEVGSPSTGRILMPLYQGLGEDGFFVARDVSPARMQLSVALRKLGADNLLPWLPGVAADRGRGDELRLAGDRPAVKEMLRLLGYRKEQTGAGELRVTRRRQVESRKRGQGGGTRRVIDDES
jgi:predicted deacylase